MRNGFVTVAQLFEANEDESIDLSGVQFDAGQAFSSESTTINYMGKIVEHLLQASTDGYKCAIILQASSFLCGDSVFYPFTFP